MVQYPEERKILQNFHGEIMGIFFFDEREKRWLYREESKGGFLSIDPGIKRGEKEMRVKERVRGQRVMK
jgi:predicted RNA-binding protein with PUA domain